MSNLRQHRFAANISRVACDVSILSTVDVQQAQNLKQSQPQISVQAKINMSTGSENYSAVQSVSSPKMAHMSAQFSNDIFTNLDLPIMAMHLTYKSALAELIMLHTNSSCILFSMYFFKDGLYATTT
jgi:hypothetical protein